MPRPHLSKPIDALEHLFAQHQDDPAMLGELLHELDHRSTDRAARLHERTASRLAQLSGDSRDVHSDRQTNTVNDEPVETGDKTEATSESAERERVHQGTGNGRGHRPSSDDDPLPPDDRHLPDIFCRIARPGVAGRPDAFQPNLATDLILNIPANATRIQRFVAALEALVLEMRRDGSGQKRHELENGRLVDRSGQRCIYAFPFVEEATLFEDAEVEVEIEGRRLKGNIVSISEGKLLIALDVEADGSIRRCVLIVDNTILLVALKERLEHAHRGEISIDIAAADAVIDKGTLPRTLDTMAHAPTGLDTAQTAALQYLASHAASFLWGPPGTGKTRTLSALVQAAFDGGKRILICSNTNKAVDQVLLAICKRLPQNHPAMDEGRILRLGDIALTELENYSAFVTAQGILGRRSRDLKQRQAEIEREITRLDAEFKTTSHLLERFTELDQKSEFLSKLRTEADTLASRGKVTVAARDRAEQAAAEYRKELDRVRASGFIRRTFMRSEEAIKRDISRSDREAAEQKQAAEQILSDFRNARIQRDQLASRVEQLNHELRGCDRKQLERTKASFDARRDPLVAELQEIAKKLADLEAAILRDAKVIGATVAKSYLRAKDLGRFDLVIIDEASMVLLPALYFVAGLAKERVVVSGDFRQLPPIVPSRQKAIHDEIGQDAFVVAGVTDRKNPRCTMLNLQHRMTEEICRLISKPMYEGELQTSPEQRIQVRPVRLLAAP